MRLRHPGVRMPPGFEGSKILYPDTLHDCLDIQ